MPSRCHRKTVHAPAGFTLVEAMVAMTIIAIAGAAVLVGVESGLQTTNDCLEQTVAAGLARQLLDEVVGGRYSEYSDAGSDTAHDSVPGPTAWEAAAGTRERFDDIGDFNAFRSQAPVDTWGVPLGQDDTQGRRRHPSFYAPSGLFGTWRQEIDVYYVSEADLATRLPAGQVSDYRAVEVRIVLVDPAGGNRTLVSLRQVVAYVPPLR